MDLEQRNFRADPLKMKRLRVAAGLTVKDFARAANMDRTTVSKILRGDPVFLKTLKVAGERVLGVDDVVELLHPDERLALGIRNEASDAGHVLEWNIDAYLSSWLETSNGLQYQLARLTHRFLDGRHARGKCYELRHLADQDRESLETHLKRHVEVCEMVGNHPNIASNITAAWLDGLWWVIDRWESGVTLAQRLAEGALLDCDLMKSVMTGIAEGLSRLHAAGIVRRELSPASILVSDTSGCPILTDLEMSKLTLGVVSVSPDEWPPDPYRATEVAGDASVDVRADIFSWGQIFIHAATGSIRHVNTKKFPPSVPAAVQEIVLRSASPQRKDRPDGIDIILSAMRDWK